MGYLCTNCFNELDIYERDKYKIDLNNKIDSYNICCPICGAYTLHEIDDLIMYPIKILNQKGYTTSFCCSGHGWEENPNTYISFLDKDHVPPILPKNFILEDDEYYKKMGWGKRNTTYNDNIAIRKHYHPINKYINTKYDSKEDLFLERVDLEKEILKTTLDLVDWVDRLPIKHTPIVETKMDAKEFSDKLLELDLNNLLLL